jgi:hypothetical protein
MNASPSDDAVCDVCAQPIVREVFQATSSSNVVTSAWFGVCGCATRKWLSRSEIGEPPWELVG